MSNCDSNAPGADHAGIPQACNAVAEERKTMLTPEDIVESAEAPQNNYGTIAYELLLLQQRLAAYEQLHVEEMTELRQEIERLRRAFLQETNPHMRAVASTRKAPAQE